MVLETGAAFEIALEDMIRIHTTATCAGADPSLVRVLDMELQTDCDGYRDLEL